MNVSNTVIPIFAGLETAAYLFLVGAGLTLIFGALRVVNIAHGTIYMYGAFGLTTLLATHQLHQVVGNFAVAICVVVVGSAVLGAVIERLVLRHLYRRDHLVQLLATFAVFYVLDDLASVAWGANVRDIQPPKALAGGIALGSWQLPLYDIFVIGVALATGCALWLLLRRSSLGWRIRAAVGDSELLQLTGVNVPLLYTTVFALGAALAGLGGAIATPGQSVAPGVDVNILVEAFVVAVIGGLGSIAGAALAALLIGMVQAYGTIYVSSLVPESVFIVMIVVLSLRPQGLLGRREAVG